MSFKETLALLLIALFIPFFVITIQFISDRRLRKRSYEIGIQNRKLNNFIPYLNTTIVNNFLDDDEIILKLQDPLIWEECIALESRWWDGKSDPSNVWEQISYIIWKEREEKHVAAGFEYWCNIMDDGVSLEWHVDKDEEELHETGELVMPIMGAVYYGFNHGGQYTGGKLHTVDAEWYENPADFDKTGHREQEVIEIDADFNRLVLFNASLWHRVTQVNDGRRYTFAVNALKNIPFAMRAAEL